MHECNGKRCVCFMENVYKEVGMEKPSKEIKYGAE